MKKVAKTPEQPKKDDQLAKVEEAKSTGKKTPQEPKSAGKDKQKVFKRIDEEKITFVTDDIRVTNNSYQATFGSQGWGGTAAQHLAKGNHQKLFCFCVKLMSSYF